MVDLLEQGTTSRNAFDLVVEQEVLGATITPSTGVDSSRLFLTAPTDTLPLALDLMADMALRPLFHPDSVARVRARRLAEIAEERTQPASLASRAIGRLMYGDRHPYAMASTSWRARSAAGSRPIRRDRRNSSTCPFRPRSRGWWWWTDRIRRKAI